MNGNSILDDVRDGVHLTGKRLSGFAGKVISSRQSSAAEAVICDACGARLREIARFCDQCGKPVAPRHLPGEEVTFSLEDFSFLYDPEEIPAPNAREDTAEFLGETAASEAPPALPEADTGFGADDFDFLTDDFGLPTVQSERMTARFDPDEFSFLF